MKLNEIFKEIFVGIRLTFDERKGEECLVVRSGDIDECRINPKEAMIADIDSIKDKYYMKKGDILIGTKKTDSSNHVGYCQSNEGEKTIILKNVIVLRDPISSYNPEFVAEYLNMKGFNSFYDSNLLLSKDAIGEYEIPCIPLNKQEELLNVINPINERTRLYQKLINNDRKIKNYLLTEVMNNEE